MRDHSDALEADLLEVFSVDLLDLWTGRLSLRRLHVLISSLLLRQGSGSLVAAVDESAIWSHEAHILARISDALEAANWLFISANSTSDNPFDAPEPMWRPGIAPPEPPPPVVASGSDVAAWFGQMNSL
ncbi:hypothetical protein ACFWXK_15495 [Streptomyces sp. NPDC059070]|uniref:hypothetical protein n=1 Tax=Streptomyces sp. NPDC059070 TaxID=3346713 RepID=UPI0036A239E9